MIRPVATGHRWHGPAHARSGRGSCSPDHILYRLYGLVACTAALVLSGCGGGGGGGGSAQASPIDPPTGDPAGGWVEGVFAASSDFEDLCAMPRTGMDPDTGLPYPDAQGTVVDENNWVRSWSNELYLWYAEIIDRNPADFTTADYFDLARTFERTASGRLKDRFHFTLPTAEWRDLALTGTTAGYGARLAWISQVPPRELVVAFVEPNSPAATDPANILRGARILSVDGVDLVNSNSSAEIGILNAGLFPSGAGETHTFTVRDPGLDNQRMFTMTSAEVVSEPVPTVGALTTPTGNIGYLLFNSHIATSELALIDAIDTLAAEPIDDLVLDVRYNGGGFLAIASELAYMIAGQTTTAARTFELTQFNDKHPTTDPVTGELLEPMPFYDVALGFSASAGQPLPSLNLPRIYVLTTGNTCSASESIINALRGVDVEVIQIGGTTCGKPYGFYPTDNCGTTYFSIQLQGVNDKGFGDYSDGFAPANSSAPASTLLPGCAVADDFEHALGDPAEAGFEAARFYRDFGSCPAGPAVTTSTLAEPSAENGGGDIRLIRPVWETIRLLDGP